MELLELFVTQSVLVKVFHKIPDFSELGDLQDNWKLVLLSIAPAWILGAFGEEMVYRGYLMNRVAGLFRKPEFAWALSLVFVRFLFGLTHIDQGITGQVENMMLACCGA